MQSLENKACLKQCLSCKEMQQTPPSSITEIGFLDKQGDLQKAQLGLAVRRAVRAGEAQPRGLVNARTGGAGWAVAAGLPCALPGEGGPCCLPPLSPLPPASLPASTWKLGFHAVRLRGLQENCWEVLRAGGADKGSRFGTGLMRSRVLWAGQDERG